MFHDYVTVDRESGNVEYQAASDRVGDDNEDITEIQTARYNKGFLWQETTSWIMTHFPEVRDPSCYLLPSL